MKKKLCWCWMLFVLGIACMVTSGCQSENAAKAPYLSMTVTHATAVEEQFEMDVYCFDLSSEQMEKVAALPYTAQYPLTVYDRKRDLVYYTADADDHHGDEVFSYDRATGAARQLTQDFFAVNYMFPTADGLWIGAVKRGDHRTVQPFLYHSATRRLEETGWDEDFFIRSACYDAGTGDVYVAGYSEKEEEAMFQTEEEIDGIRHWIYRVNDGEREKILEKDACRVKTIVARDGVLLYRSGDRTFDPVQEIGKIHLGTGEEETLELEQALLAQMEDFVYLDGDQLYYLRMLYGEEDISQLCRMDLRTQEIQVLFTAPANAKINNAVAVCG